MADYKRAEDQAFTSELFDAFRRASLIIACLRLCVDVTDDPGLKKALVEHDRFKAKLDTMISKAANNG